MGREGALAHDYAQRALALDKNDAMVQVVLARILVYRRRYDEAAHHLDRALMLNPNDTDVLVTPASCRPTWAIRRRYWRLRTRRCVNPAHPP